MNLNKHGHKDKRQMRDSKRNVSHIYRIALLLNVSGQTDHTQQDRQTERSRAPSIALNEGTFLISEILLTPTNPMVGSSVQMNQFKMRKTNCIVEFRVSKDGKYCWKMSIKWSLRGQRK